MDLEDVDYVLSYDEIAWFQRERQVHRQVLWSLFDGDEEKVKQIGSI